MIDEMKLDEEAEYYTESVFSYFEAAHACKLGFIAGAEWAQKEFTNSLWHDASEEPKGFNEWIIIKYDKYSYIVTHQVKEEDHWDNMAKHSPSFHWCYLSDICVRER